MAGAFILILLIAMVAYYIHSSHKRIATLKERYEASLSGTDKRVALDAGRSYYSSLRKGKTLTIYDEQAITNDLSTMP